MVLVALPFVALVGCGGVDAVDPAASPTATPTLPTATPVLVDVGDPEAYAADLFAATNAARAAEELPELPPSDCAAEHALERAEKLVGLEGLAHAPLEGVIADCAPATGAAENLVRSAAAPEAVVQAWLDSPGHRANLLSADYAVAAITCVPDGEELVCSHVFLNAEVP
ncbi:CAP domain-containing protein [Litorihabitans aurantiacus]|uniref:CAP domain-containing protein n=1 Tax=Litorihabitans aurantiacus TaxID=1930061 RepID=UPI0024E0A4F8|nr:CAP domain-containing protein [Litorihabitans aurantiacus]